MGEEDLPFAFSMISELGLLIFMNSHSWPEISDRSCKNLMRTFC